MGYKFPELFERAMLLIMLSGVQGHVYKRTWSDTHRMMFFCRMERL